MDEQHSLDLPQPNPGDRTNAASYFMGRSLFLGLLGLVYLIAFTSLWVQIDGLVGSDGILPVADYLDWISERAGAERYRIVPTLLWLGDGDLALHLLCGGGVLLSLALIVGVAPIPVLVLLWAFYLSLSVGGQTFLSFQWDALLLETGFCALFVAPATLRPRGIRWATPPSRAGLWLLRLLLFKLMFLSGAVKPLSMDDTWWKLTAMDFHYWTQPIPTWTAWYAHQLPEWFQKFSIILTYVIEMALPFLIFTGRIGRRIAAAGTVFLMLMISWTGNYGFFNLLAIVLCVPLIDDEIFARFLPAAVRTPQVEPDATARPGLRKVRRAALVVAVVMLVAVSFVIAVEELVRTVPPNHEGTARTLADAGQRWLLDWTRPVVRHVRPFHTINGYGLFRSMTTQRPEIVVEGSHDGTTWSAYEFRWKPGDPAGRPGFVAPHMPRLDWQMWFAALNPRRAQHWLEGLMRGLLRGSPDVLALLDTDPFAGEPPSYVRLMYYQYRFASPEERRDRGYWWVRELSGPLTPTVSLEALERR